MSPNRSLRCLAVSILAAVSATLSFAGTAGATPDFEVYWYYTGAIEHMGIDGSNRETLINGIPGGWGLDASAAVGKMYWADQDDGQILRANLNGGGMEVVIDGFPGIRDVVIDADAGHIYWSDIDVDKIRRADLDGTNVVDILSGVDFVTCLHLDSANGKLYFSESTTDTVRRVNLDGSSPQIVLQSTSYIGGDPRGVDLDLARGQIYYSDLKRDAIFRANLDGSNEVPFVTGLDSVFDLQILPQTDEIFWFENTTGIAYRSPLGTAAPVPISTNAGAVGMAIVPEPGTLAFLGLGIVAFGRRRSRPRRP